jgi:hypothetical protein
MTKRAITLFLSFFFLFFFFFKKNVQLLTRLFVCLQQISEIETGALNFTLRVQQTAVQ